MSLADPGGPRGAVRALAAGALSVALHAGAAAGFMTAPPAPAPDDGLNGALLIELEPMEEAASAPATPLPPGPAAADAPPAPDAPEEIEVAAASDAPLMQTTPYRVKDPELAFAIANPDQQIDTPKQAKDVPTIAPPQPDRPSAAPSRAMAPPPADGARKARAAAAARTEGLTRRRKREVAEWHKKLVLALNARKTYPDAARDAGAEGRAVLRFTVDRIGRVQVRAVAQSAGDAALDAATLAILAPGDLLPPPPGHMAGARFDLAIPITYTLRRG